MKLTGPFFAGFYSIGVLQISARAARLVYS